MKQVTLYALTIFLTGCATNAVRTSSSTPANTISSLEFQMIDSSMKPIVSGGTTEIEMNTNKIAKCRQNTLADPPGFRCSVQFLSGKTIQLTSRDIDAIFKTMQPIVSGGHAEVDLSGGKADCEQNTFAEIPGFRCTFN